MVALKRASAMARPDRVVVHFSKPPLLPCLLQSSWAETLPLFLICGTGCIRKRFWLVDADSFSARCPQLISLFGTWRRSAQAFRLPLCSAVASGTYLHTPQAAITDQRQEHGKRPSPRRSSKIKRLDFEITRSRLAD